MSKFVIECPSCGRYTEANGGIMGFFATKKINCQCGYVINVKTDKMKTKTCPHCGNMVVFDQSKGEEAVCPVCHEHINTLESMSSLVDMKCPSCSCNLTVDKNADSYTCPLCDTVIDVQNQISKEKVKNEGLASVIKYEGDNETLIWKHPIEDFNMGSQLIVHESQEAIFFRDGKALDLFGSGRYTLETSQLPILENLYKLPTDTSTTFHSEVYYINKANHMAFKWGTSDKITLIDPTSQAPIAIGARGMFNFTVSDSRKMLLKLVGTTKELNRKDIFETGVDGNNKHVRDYFRSIVQLGVSTKLAEIITSENIDILQIDQQKMRLSEKLKESLIPYFDDYGMAISEFLVEGIVLPEAGELGYDVIKTLIKLRQANLTKQVISTETDIKLSEMEAKKTIDIRTEENAVEVETAHRETVAAKGQTEVLQAQIEAQRKLAEAQGDVAAERLHMQLEMERKAQTAQIEAEEMRAKGYSQKDVIQGQVLTAFAENQPSGGAGMGSMSGVAGQALQMGAGFATMGAMAGMATNMMGTGAQLGKEMMGAMPGMTTNMNDNNQVAPGGFNMGNAMAGGIMAAGTASMMSQQNNNQQFQNTNSDVWNCSCGCQNITSKFCPDCGSKKPEPVMKPMGWTCTACGISGITSKFCPDCGAKRPEDDTWTCSKCGMTGIKSKFCPDCGSPKEA